MNQSVFDLTQQHRSVRQFKDEPLSKETVEKLVKAGQNSFNFKLRSSLFYYWYYRPRN